MNGSKKNVGNQPFLDHFAWRLYLWEPCAVNTVYEVIIQNLGAFPTLLLSRAIQFDADMNGI